jgi:hypothetical protein
MEMAHIPCTRPAAIEQAFGTKWWSFGVKNWSFGVTIVDGFSHSLPPIPGELASGVRRLFKAQPRFFRQRRSLGAIFPAH